MGENHLIAGPDGRPRCWWSVSDPLYLSYHDQEWGFPLADDRRIFEKICLEGFQSGLSWLTILRKREGFRHAFAGFDFERVARFGSRRVESLLADRSIVRHRGKIEATIQNARGALAIVQEFGSLAAYLWDYEPLARPVPKTVTDLPASTAESSALSRDLKRRGWSFVGPTTIYAAMQALGLVNDHLKGCSVRAEVEAARRSFARPGR